MNVQTKAILANRSQNSYTKDIDKSDLATRKTERKSDVDHKNERHKAIIEPINAS
jgi:hypothetical protein